MIERVKTGVLVNDIKDCYRGIEDHCVDLVVAGDVIEYKNNEKKTSVLYPRFKAFLTQMPGTASIAPGQQKAVTSMDLRGIIYRGDAIRIGTTCSWYRVAHATGVGDDRWNKMSSSVIGDAEPTSRHGFLDEFTETVLPLDADYEGKEAYNGPIYKHGCTNDIRQYWNESAIEMRKNVSGEEALMEELLKYKLISRPEMTLHMQQQKHGLKRNAKDDAKKSRKKTVRSSSANNYHNAHLKGSELERIVNEAYASSMQNDT